jgi:hypothetical protein
VQQKAGGRGPGQAARLRSQKLDGSQSKSKLQKPPSGAPGGLGLGGGCGGCGGATSPVAA